MFLFVLWFLAQLKQTAFYLYQKEIQFIGNLFFSPGLSWGSFLSGSLAKKIVQGSTTVVELHTMALFFQLM